MVHAGIEHGVMAAHVEGLSILRNADAGECAGESDAEATSLHNPEHCPRELELAEIALVSRQGGVIGSWLPDLTAAALVKDHELNDDAGRVSDSGEVRWTIGAAVDDAVPVAVPGAALHERFSPRGDADFADRLLSAMHGQFGGHDAKQKAES
jgi:6-phosphogluconate dehydrogenase